MKPILTPLQSRLLRALLAKLTDRSTGTTRPDRYEPSVIVELFDSTDWTSLTFAGQRHRIVLRIAGATDEEAARIAADITDDLTVPGQIVADVRIASRPINNHDAALTIKVLTIDDPQ